ncbi:MAG: glycine--tRNA ligase subunit beta [Pseudomonadota bacterium]
MSARDLLFELGTEELPPKSLKTLSDALTSGIEKGLGEASLTFDSIRPYATPRRLAVHVEGLAERQPEQVIARRGPPVRIAFDENGQPTKAAQKFIDGCGVTLDDIGRQKTDKGEWLFYEGRQAGEPASALLPGIIDDALRALPIAKRMRWGTRDVEFVRPVQWSVLLLGDDVIEADFIGARSGRTTFGHRFHAPAAVDLARPADYAGTLEKHGRVIADFAARRARITDMVNTTARALDGTAIVDDALMDEVTALVEWPVPVAGRFDEAFLALPEEVLISTLKDHQRYFALRGEDGALLPWFITIANIDSDRPEAVRDGNERVVHPRLSDARFFYSQDQRTALADRVASLDSVLFQKQLGSLGDKVRRVRELATQVAPQIGADRDVTARAADLCKSDLVTEMVGEFPELQGTMGRYYATHDGEADEVARAIEEHYRPRFAGDDLPETGAGRAVSLADRIDTLVGIFAIGKPPSGTRDPFGLRRAALGVLRLLTETGADVDLASVVRQAAQQLPDLSAKDNAASRKPRKALPSGEALVSQVMDYLTERLRGMALEQGATTGQFDAVVSLGASRPVDVMARVAAVRTFAATPAAEALIAANKRIANILRKVDEELTTVDTTRFDSAPETALYDALTGVTREVSAAVSHADYVTALDHLATLRGPVDAFFDDVLVMADDPDVRLNRLALLSEVRALFLNVADISLAAQ